MLIQRIQFVQSSGGISEAGGETAVISAQQLASFTEGNCITVIVVQQSSVGIVNILCFVVARLFRWLFVFSRYDCANRNKHSSRLIPVYGNILLQKTPWLFIIIINFHCLSLLCRLWTLCHCTK